MANAMLEFKAASFGFLGGLLAISIWRFYENRLRWLAVARRRRLAIERGSPELEKMTSGSDYQSFEERLLAMLQSTHALCEEFNSQGRSVAERQQIISRLLGSCGESPYVEPPFYCDYGFNISVGNNFYINFGCVFLDCAEIRIGDNCYIGPGVKLYTAAHPLDAVQRRSVEFARPIKIGNDVWIGGDVVICPGVTIGSRVVIAAGAVVTNDIPDDVLVAGVPSKVKRQLSK